MLGATSSSAPLRKVSAHALQQSQQRGLQAGVPTALRAASASWLVADADSDGEGGRGRGGNAGEEDDELPAGTPARSRTLLADARQPAPQLQQHQQYSQHFSQLHPQLQSQPQNYHRQRPDSGQSGSAPAATLRQSSSGAPASLLWVSSQTAASTTAVAAGGAQDSSADAAPLQSAQQPRAPQRRVLSLAARAQQRGHR